MGLDTVSSSGYQGGNTEVNAKQVQTGSYNREGLELTGSLQEEKIRNINIALEDGVTSNIANSDVKKSISEINSKLNKNTEAIFGIHEATNRVTIKIVDKDSKEVIKEIPPEKTLEMIAKVWEFAGLLIDEKL